MSQDRTRALIEANKMRHAAPVALVAAAELLDVAIPGNDDMGRAVSTVLALAPSPFVAALALAQAGMGWRERIGTEWTGTSRWS